MTCAEDLVGEVDKITRARSCCRTPTRSNRSWDDQGRGTTVNHEMTPALNQDQLQKQVSMLVKQNGIAADTVTCEGGLEGVVGNKTKCTVGVAVRRWRPPSA